MNGGEKASSYHLTRAYSEFFKEIKPVITMAEVSALARPAHLIEIEAEAVLGSYRVSKT